MIEIAVIINRNLVTVSDNITAYLEGNIDGLPLGQSTGKPPKLSTEQTAFLLEFISTSLPKSPPMRVLRLDTIGHLHAPEFVKNKWDVSYTLRGMSSLFHRLGLSYTRPTYTLEKAVLKNREYLLKKHFHP